MRHMGARGRSIGGRVRNRLTGSRQALPPGYPVTELMKVWYEDRGFFDEMRRFDPTERSIDRKFFLRELLKLVDHLEGDTAEAGVYEGASSWLICKARGGRSTHWAFDSFAGLSAPNSRDGTFWSAGDLASSEASARALLEPLGAIVLKGWIPEVFSGPSIERL